ncbi:MAG: V-type ATP synthase subunit D [Candidatus Hodarchaeales archaeon]
MSSEDIISGITPTRMQLLELKERLQLASKGHELLSEKLEALTGELFSTVTDYKKKRIKVKEQIFEARKSLNQLQIQMGEFGVQKIALSYPRKFRIERTKKNLMGIAIPIFNVTKEESLKKGKLLYSMHDTTARFDLALDLFETTLLDLIELAEVQSKVTRLAKEITETKRRVNALHYIIIPRIQATISWIKLTLAEREREAFVRLKKVKKKISSKEK